MDVVSVSSASGLGSSIVQNWSSARGRVWPGQTMGICLPGAAAAEVDSEEEDAGAGATAAMVELELLAMLVEPLNIDTMLD